MLPISIKNVTFTKWKLSSPSISGSNQDTLLLWARDSPHIDDIVRDSKEDAIYNQNTWLTFW